MNSFSRLRQIVSVRKSRTDQPAGSSNLLSLSASRKTYAKVFGVSLLASSILILAPTVLLSGGLSQKQVGGGGGVTGTGLKPTFSQAVAFVETPAVRDLVFQPPTAEETEQLNQNREEREKNLQNKERVKPEPDPKKNGPFTDPGINNFKHQKDTNKPDANTVTNPIVNFLGPDADVGAPLYGTRFVPPDTNAAVGPNNVVAITNMGVRVYDKAGSPLTAQFRLSTLLVGIPNAADDDGDPVVLYDQLADRWILSQFNLTVTNNSTHQHIAISKTGDPTGAYYAYDFLMTANRPGDYPHIGVWHDGYYMSTNDFSFPPFSNPFQGAGLYVFERTKMLVGDPTAKIIGFNTNNLHGGMLPTNLQGYKPAPAGTPNLFYEYDADELGAATDLIRAFAFHADFNVPGNSTLTQGPDIPTLAFDARSSSVQEPSPGEDLDALADRLMHAVNFRVLPGGVQSYVLNFTVNVSGVNPTSSALYQAGVRWMELRRNSGTGAVTINQQATYAPGSGSGTGRDVWMAAVAQDGEGNIGLGMSASAPAPTPLNPTALYTGRLAGDPANTLPQGEVDALSAVTKGVQLSNSFNRWGDYSSMFIDPADDCTFWGAFEYVDSPNATFDWNTRIFSFKVNPTCVTSPRGTISGTITNCSGGAPILNALITTPDGFIRQTNASGQFSMTVAPGTYNVTVSKSGGGFNTCGGMVTVSAGGSAMLNCCLLDSGPCAIDCPANITKPNDQNQCGAVVSYAAPSASQSCGTVLCAPGSGSFFQKGVTTVTCTTTAGPTCSFTVTVQDTQPPSITNGCPAAINVAVDYQCPYLTSTQISYASPVATDNCPGVMVTCNPPSGSNFPVGATVVTCTATDTSNNTASCSFVVTVYSACLVDETSSDRVVMFNAATGDYRFCCGGVLQASGRGSLTVGGCNITINHVKGNRTVHIAVTGSFSGSGTAYIQKNGVQSCQINDKKMSGNTCTCP